MSGPCGERDDLVFWPVPRVCVRPTQHADWHSDVLLPEDLPVPECGGEDEPVPTPGAVPVPGARPPMGLLAFLANLANRGAVRS